MAVKWSNELRFYVGGYDLSTATTKASITRSAPALDKTVFGDAAESAIADVEKDLVEWSGLFEDGTQGIDRQILDGSFGTVGAVVSFMIGTATGSRAYSGVIFTQSVKVGARMGELVQVVSNYKPDTSLDPTRHFAPLRTVTAASQSPTTGLDDGAASTGTHRVYYHVTRLLGGGTLQISLQDSASAGSGWSNVGGLMTFTGSGSTADSFTGTLRQYVRLQWDFVGASGSTDFFASYKR